MKITTHKCRASIECKPSSERHFDILPLDRSFHKIALEYGRSRDSILNLHPCGTLSIQRVHEITHEDTFFPSTHMANSYWQNNSDQRDFSVSNSGPTSLPSSSQPYYIEGFKRALYWNRRIMSRDSSLSRAVAVVSTLRKLYLHFLSH